MLAPRAGMRSPALRPILLAHAPDCSPHVTAKFCAWSRGARVPQFLGITAAAEPLPGVPYQALAGCGSRPRALRRLCGGVEAAVPARHGLRRR